MKTVNKKSLIHLDFRDALDIFKNLEGKSEKIPQVKCKFFEYLKRKIFIFIPMKQNMVRW